MQGSLVPLPLQLNMDHTSKKFRIVSLGCRTNQYEAQAYRDQLEALGYRPAADDEGADLCIVNTCTVTLGADRDSRHEIRKLARQQPGARLVVTGCSAESQQEAIREIEGVTDVVLNKDKERLVELLFPDLGQWPEFAIQHFDSHTRAFLKVQDGCNSFCTYCIIPYVRGRSRSRPLDDIVAEAHQLVANGYKEIVLTGINIGDFDGAKAEQPDRLADLVRAVDAVPGLERLRISSIDPDEVDDELIEVVLSGKTTCPSMHIVLQAGSNVVLKRMNRKYTRQVFLDTVERLRTASPDFTMTTDVIVGFPGETDSDFQDTVDVLRQVRFAKVHMFPFSPRPRTRAATMPNQVSADVMRERKQQLMRIAEKESFQLRQQYVGRRMTVLTEENDGSRPGEASGHTENFLMVWLPEVSLRSNQLVEVELIDNRADGLVGRLVGS